jgi:Bifunctional DNA primase/polymerase, N-terminal
MSLADAATAAAAAGLKVFPLKVRSKEPRVAGGFKSASGDPGYIAGLWSSSGRTRTSVSLFPPTLW